MHQQRLFISHVACCSPVSEFNLTIVAWDCGQQRLGGKQDEGMQQKPTQKRRPVLRKKRKNVETYSVKKKAPKGKPSQSLKQNLKVLWGRQAPRPSKTITVPYHQPERLQLRYGNVSAPIVPHQTKGMDLQLDALLSNFQLFKPLPKHL